MLQVGHKLVPTRLSFILENLFSVCESTDSHSHCQRLIDFSGAAPEGCGSLPFKRFTTGWGHSAARRCQLSQSALRGNMTNSPVTSIMRPFTQRLTQPLGLSAVRSQSTAWGEHKHESDITISPVNSRSNMFGTSVYD